MSQGRLAVRVPGTCGELVQGTYQGEYAIITAPIDRYAVALAQCVELAVNGPAPCWQVSESYDKVAAALRTAAARQRLTGGGLLTLESTLPRGKGFGSSTADITAALAATSMAEGRPMATAELAQICASIEPSDGTMHAGVSLFASRTGALLERLPPPPPVMVGVLDWGGRVDTLQFHRRLAGVDNGHKAAAFQAVMAGLKQQNPWDIGWGATQSALAHQSVLPKPGLERLAEWVKAAGGYGICVAHTGTIAGMLFPPGVDWAEVRRDSLRVVPEVAWWGTARLGCGGIEFQLDADSCWAPWPSE